MKEDVLGCLTILRHSRSSGNDPRLIFIFLLISRGLTVPDDKLDELEVIKAKKLAEFQRRQSKLQQKTPEETKKPQIDDEALVRSNLIDRGNEVLDAALLQYPQQTRQVISNIAILYKSGKLNQQIPGEELLNLFRDLGMRIHIETTISFIKDGKRISLSDQFKGKTKEE